MEGTGGEERRWLVGMASPITAVARKGTSRIFPGKPPMKVKISPENILNVPLLCVPSFFPCAFVFPLRASVPLWRRAFLFCLLASVFLIGCASQPKKHTESPTLQTRGDLEARVDPPQGWIAEPIKSSARHVHQVWLSPSRDTAYGVIRFSLPLPVGSGLALWGFLNEMKKTEGASDLLERHDDPDSNAIHFIARGGRYTVRGRIQTDGWKAWVAYAGTVTNQPVRRQELRQAEEARDRTQLSIGTGR